MWNDDNPCFASNICRICANVCDVLVPLFGKEEEKERIDLKIKKCLPIVVREEDCKPKQVCYTCISKLEVCIELIELSLSAEFKFESILQDKFPPLALLKGIVHESTSINVASESSKNVSGLEGALAGPQAPRPTRAWPDDPSQEGAGVIVLSKMDAGQPSQDMVFMVELKYKDGDQAYADAAEQQPKAYTLTYSADGRGPADAEQKPITYVSEVCPDKSQSHVVVYTTDLQPIALTKVTFTQDETSDGRQVYTEMDREVSVERSDLDLKASALGIPETESNVELDDTIDETMLLGPPRSRDVGVVESALPAKGDKKFPCTICNKSFMRRTNLNAHMGAHTQVRPYSCFKCGKTFVLRWDLTLHMRIHSGTFTCEFCSKAFAVQGKLERHRRTHTGERPFSCTICSKAFGDKRNLESHERTHSGERPFTCTTCGRSFRVRSHLTDHTRVHSQDAAYKCAVCNKSFKWKTNLNIHLKVHTGERHPCDGCGREFARRADLNRHRRTHADEREHVCVTCGKRYAERSVLQKHLRVHAEHRPHACDVCGKSFHFQWYLSSHKKTHLEEKNFPCEHCDRVFAKKANLLTHCKSHAIDTEPDF